MVVEYISREAALQCIEDAAVVNFKLDSDIYHRAMALVRAIPAAADVVEVVRCRECRYRDPEDKKCDSGALERAGCVFPVDDDYYCADGKRKAGGQDDA